MKSFNKKLQVMAVAAALGAGAAGSAQAGVIAQSVLQITNFQFLNPNGSTINVNQFSQLVFSDSTDVTATLNGTSDVGSLNQNFFGTLDLAQQCVGACGFAQNDYTSHTAQTVIVARGDTLLTGAPLAGTAFAVGADASTLAEAQVAGDNTGSTQSNLGLLATFSFALLADQAVGVSFDADQFLIAFLTADALLGSNAQASSSWTIELAQGGTTLFEWTPNGAAGGITGGDEITDDCDLTRTVAAQVPGQNAQADCSGSFEAFTDFNLIGGTLYTLNLRHTSEADASSVPEPSVLALLGLGLLGMGFGVRRNKKTAA